MLEAAPIRRAAGTHDAYGLSERAAQEEGLGRWDAAARLYALTFRASVMDRNLGAAADALRGQARVRNHQRRHEEADELALLSLEIAERNGLPQAAARAVNVLGVIRYSTGDWAGARPLYAQALDRALDLGDDDLAGLACQNAGVIAHLRGELYDARTLYLESIGSFVRSGNSVNCMAAYHNLGIVSVYLGEWLEAEVFFSRGIEIGERTSNAPGLARLYMNRSHPLIQVDELSRAITTVNRAEEEARMVEDLATLADVERFRGMLARMEGRVADAELHLARALAMGEGEGTGFVRGGIFWEFARLRVQQHRPGDAGAFYGRAAAAFGAVGARYYERAVTGELEALAG
jgi:tetratricopeptide (TPR) repeat protein